MNFNLMAVFMGLMGLFCLVIAFQSLRSGVVKWRNGSVAAERLSNPGFYWFFILMYVFVGGAILLAAGNMS